MMSQFLYYVVRNQGWRGEAQLLHKSCDRQRAKTKLAFSWYYCIPVFAAGEYMASVHKFYKFTLPTDKV